MSDSLIDSKALNKLVAAAVAEALPAAIASALAPLSAALAGIGKGKRGRSAAGARKGAAPRRTGKAWKLAPEVQKALLDSVKGKAEKEGIKNGKQLNDALKKAEGISLGTNAMLVVDGGKVESVLLEKTFSKLAKWTGFHLPARPGTDGATVITPPSGSASTKRKSKKK